MLQFWHGGVGMFGDKWIEADKEMFYSIYDLNPQSAFPLSYSVPDTIILGGIEGSIPGFGYFSDKNEILFTT